MLNKYTYKVIWSNKEKQYIGLCNELPRLSYINKDKNTALSGIKEFVKIINELNNILINHIYDSINV